MGRIDLSRVAVRRCAKPNCRFRNVLNRHHTRHEAMWLSIWKSRWYKRADIERWILFQNRYYQFKEEDCVTLCLRHHAEIHQLYDRVIQEDQSRLDIPLSKYTWTQAGNLMEKLRKTCMKWLEDESPGIDPRSFAQRRYRRHRQWKKDRKQNKQS